jgi:hypothetical protein
MSFSETQGILESHMPKQNGINLVTVIALDLVAVIAGSTQPNKAMAQRAVEEIKAGHPEISGLEMAATKSEAEVCNHRRTEANEVGQKLRQRRVNGDPDEQAVRRKREG